MRFYIVVVAFVLLCLVSGCMKNRITATNKDHTTGRYGNEIPSGIVSDEIGKITQSVKKVYSVSSYTTYQFKREAMITGYHLYQGTFKKAAWGVISTNETVFGTATVIGFTNSTVALLTCAHVLNSPDTLISYFDPVGEDPSYYIQSVSIKEKQENWVKDISSCGSFTILASDNTADIAFLGKKCENLTDSVTPFPVPSGSARELGWGNLVYVFGYPMGNQVMTSGIVSLSVKRPMGEFTVDALMNKGFSGGIILAHRGGTPDFELVGMVKSVNSSREVYLKPSSDQERTPDWMPYKGALFVEKSDNLQYGLNAVVPMESILDFYIKNRKDLIRNGYNLDHFFLPEKK
ncbi:MAG: serine protease [Bacteroidota bacterium]